MTELDPGKVNVRFVDDVVPTALSLPRRYTLTHSDRTGDRFLTIGRDYDLRQISGAYTRFMRDEVLAEWLDDHVPRLHIYLHVSGGVVFGNAGLRLRIFRSCLRSVLQALRYGDDALFTAEPALDQGTAVVHYSSTKDRFNFQEETGPLTDYRLT